MTFCDLTIYNDNPATDQTLYRTRPLTEFWVVTIEHLRRVWHADRGRLLLRTPGHVPLGLPYVLLVETNPFPNLSLFYRTMLFEYPSVLSRFCFSFKRRVVVARYRIICHIYLLLGTKTRGMSIYSIAINPLDSIWNDKCKFLSYRWYYVFHGSVEP